MRACMHAYLYLVSFLYEAQQQQQQQQSQQQQQQSLPGAEPARSRTHNLNRTILILVAFAIKAERREP